MAPPPSLCLNMIVKNESKVILRMLESVAPILDSYCICDTGSTDNTIELIEGFFQERDIPGVVVCNETFKDFGYNRTKALEAAAQLPAEIAEYVLLMDADMVLWRNPTEFDTAIFKQRLVNHQAAYIMQGSDTFKYKNTRIVKNHLGFSYWGVTHEYVKNPEGINITYDLIEPTYMFIQDIGDGGAKQDKFERDIRLLTKGLEDLPNNDRYTFYLANSYRDYGDNEKAIETYRKRIEIGGWIEETWQSYYQMGKCYAKLGKIADAIGAWMDAYHAYPNRVENLYEIIHHYRVEGKNSLAYHFYLLAEESLLRYPNLDHLFTQNDVYEYKLDYELSIIGYYCNKQGHDLALACMKTIIHPFVGDGTYRNVLSNYKFYSPHISQYGLAMNIKNVTALQTVGRETMKPFLDEFVASTPSLCWDPDTNRLMVCLRYVNYRIGDKGEYINQEHITTRNFMAEFHIPNSNLRTEWTKLREAELRYETQLDGRYVGQEDVRLFWYKDVDSSGGRILYNGNRGLDQSENIPSTHSNSHMAVEHGWIRIDADCDMYRCNNSKLLVYDKQRETEKNWCLFQDVNNNGGQVKCIYSWSPLVIGTIDPDEGIFTETHRINDGLPFFFKDVRCSTNGVRIGDELWFIAHLVSYEDRRYYYHVIVVLDAATYKVRKYTRLWRFEKDNKVEYTLGFVWFESSNRFLIGYSVMDRETKYVMLPRHIFDELWVGS